MQYRQSQRRVPVHTQDNSLGFRTRRSFLATAAFAVALLSAGHVTGAAETVRLTQLDLANLHFEGWSKPRVDRSFSGKPLSIAGRKFEHGIGTRALTSVWLELDGRVEKFTAAVGLCNRGETTEAVRAAWRDVGVTGRQRVRDLWRQKDLGVFEDQFRATIPRHGVVLVRIASPASANMRP